MKEEKVKTKLYMTFKGCDCLMEIGQYGLSGGIKCREHNNRQTLKCVRK